MHSPAVYQSRSLMLVAVILTGSALHAELPGLKQLISDAESALKEAEAEKGELIMVRYHLAYPLTATGRVKDALKITQVKLPITDVHNELIRACLRVARKKGDALPAEKDVRKSLQGGWLSDEGIEATVACAYAKILADVPRFTDAIDIVEKISPSERTAWLIADAYSEIADLQQAAGKRADAIESLRRAIQVGRAQSCIDELSDTMRLLAEIQGRESMLLRSTLPAMESQMRKPPKGRTSLQSQMVDWLAIAKGWLIINEKDAARQAIGRAHRIWLPMLVQTEKTRHETQFISDESVVEWGFAICSILEQIADNAELKEKKEQLKAFYQKLEPHRQALALVRILEPSEQCQTLIDVSPVKVPYPRLREPEVRHSIDLILSNESNLGNIRWLAIAAKHAKQAGAEAEASRCLAVARKLPVLKMRPEEFDRRKGLGILETAFGNRNAGQELLRTSYLVNDDDFREYRMLYAGIAMVDAKMFDDAFRVAAEIKERSEPASHALLLSVLCEGIAADQNSASP